MANNIGIKVCGMTEAAGVQLALSLGADKVGFILYPKSPRALTLESAQELAALAPEEQRVLVDVEPDLETLQRYRQAGFKHFQIHVNLPASPQVLAEYSDCVGHEQLCLAPRLAPADIFPEWILEYADTILLDTYAKNQVGGTGYTGDFSRFAKLKQQFGSTRWILAGGLSAFNVMDAIAVSTASQIDVNSGVESAPGKKDPVKLREFFSVLRG